MEMLLESIFLAFYAVFTEKIDFEGELNSKCEHRIRCLANYLVTMKNFLFFYTSKRRFFSSRCDLANLSHLSQGTCTASYRHNTDKFPKIAVKCCNMFSNVVKWSEMSWNVVIFLFIDDKCHIICRNIEKFVVKCH